jgi:hypothetical protein
VEIDHDGENPEALVPHCSDRVPSDVGMQLTERNVTKFQPFGNQAMSKQENKSLASSTLRAVV